MANLKHLALLQKGFTIWNSWRIKNPSVKPDFSNANLVGIRLLDFDLSEANFEGANLLSANLSRANLIRTNFQGANLSKAAFAKADLRGVDFSGSNLEGANLSQANLSGVNFHNAKLRGAILAETDLHNFDFSNFDLSSVSFRVCNLSGVNFSFANIHKAKLLRANLFQANLQGANFNEADLSYANLSEVYLNETNFNQVIFEETNLNNLDFSGFDFRKTNFSKANLRGVNFSGTDLREANLSEADLSGINLKGANLQKANLSSTDLSGFDFSEFNLHQTNFSKANLNGTNFSGANLENANLSEAKLFGVNFERANLRYIYLINTNLTGANFSEFDLSEAKLRGTNFNEANLSRANLSKADLSFSFSISDLSMNQVELMRNSTTTKVKSMLQEILSQKVVNLEGSNLEGANLEGSNLEGANLEGANLKGANLKNAAISGVKLTGSNLKGANFEETNSTKDIVRILLAQFRAFKYERGMEGSSLCSQLQAEHSVSTPEKSLLLVRYPNLDCPDRTIVNQPFSLFAQLLLEPLEQDSSTIQVEDTGTEELPKVEVVLRGRGFDFQGSNTQVIEVEREDDSEVRFILTPCQLGEQQVRVDFYQHGRRIGTVRRNILVAEQPVSTRVAQPKTALVIEMKPKPTIPAPDLELCIELNQRDGRTLSFTLHSTKEAIDFHHAKFGQVTLQGSPLDKMQAVYQDLSYLAAQPLITQGKQDTEQRKLLPVGSTSFASITQDSSERAKRRLTAVGNQLWDELIPNELKQQYWHFRYHVKSMLITSDEPWVPWEMIKPYRYSDGKEEQDPFWCQQFAISRWLSGPGTADDLPTKIVVPVAPFQSNLPSVKEEVTFLEQLSSLNSEISSLNTLSQGIELVDYVGANNEFSILHFACHGMFDGTLPNDSAIMLSDGSLRPSDIRLYFAPKSPRPLVFINACHGGRVGFSFTGLGGWAELLVKARVGAFVGAMWEVNDELALQFAKSFYKALLQDKKTIAEAFQYSREETRKLAPNNSTWLAYSLYADPEARVQDKKEIAETESMTGIRLHGY